ncbi:MAG: hypothetical protein SFU83_14025 [Meiothermus sp.]|nr:hypothetical protein [Meiothermus sp.]
MKLNLYVLVDDMSRAVGFYRRLFRSEPVMQTPAYSIFSLEGSLYGLMSAHSYPQPVSRGNNVTPNLLVEDIEAAHAHARSVGAPFVMEAIVQNGPYRLFVCIDSEGNALEFYSQP